MQSININVTKIDKSALFDGKNGKYLGLTLFENRDGVDQYGNNGFVTQDLGKERRMAGEKGPILGNWKHIGQPVGDKSSPTQNAHNTAKTNAYQPQADDNGNDDIPF